MSNNNQAILTRQDSFEDVISSPEGATPNIVSSPSPKLKSSSPKIHSSPRHSPALSSTTAPSPARRSYAEPYSVQPQPPPISLDKEELPARPFHSQTTVHTIWRRIIYPAGVEKKHRLYEHWLGKIGFGGKGVIYGFVGGMTCTSASRLTEELNGSPQGAFILIGDFPGGQGLLVVMLLSLLCYVAWRWWEFFTFQGADATFSPFKNFFTFRLSPFISGAVYIAYGYYIIEILANDNKPTCYPDCWRDSGIGKAALVLFGIAFTIACITQLANAFTRKWHYEINWDRCKTKYEKYAILSLGHAGFAGRAGLFLFVAILMFRALSGKVHQSGNTMSNGINQFIGTGAGRVFMFIIGALIMLYALFALLCTYYRFFPTPPPSGRPLIYRMEDDDMQHLPRTAEVVREEIVTTTTTSSEPPRDVAYQV